MTSRDRSRNRALLRHILLPMIFLTVALLGGLRIDVDTKAFVFIPPPLMTLIFSTLLVTLCVRGHLVELEQWINGELPPLTNISHILTLLTFFFGSAQAFNSVLPEHGLLFWLFSFFFLWTLWNHQFATFNGRRLLWSLSVLFGTAFFLKHVFLASLFSPKGGLVKKIVGIFVEVGTLGTIDSQVFAPATGYISFFTLAFYVLGLILLTPTPETAPQQPGAQALVRTYRDLLPAEQAAVREAIVREWPGTTGTQGAVEAGEIPKRYDTVEVTGELVTDNLTEETRELKTKN